MTQQLDITLTLTEEERRQVQNFAEFLISRRRSPALRPKPKYINVDALAGLCAGMGGDKTAVELAHEATASRGEKDRGE